MSTNKERITEYLRQHGYSATTARLSVFEVLARASHPLNIQDLAVSCLPIDRSSVYRAIELFERLGIVLRIQIGWKYKLELSDHFRPHHHHATCLRCGSTLELSEDAQLENILERIAREHGFHMRQHQIELTGLCENCRGIDSIA